MVALVERWVELLPAETRDQWYFRIREELIKRLGGVCIECGSKGSNFHRDKKYLEIDHKVPRSYIISMRSKTKRALTWLEEFARGEIRVKCRSCNGAANGS